MKPRDKVALQEFSIDTMLEPEAIRKAAQRAADAGTRFMTSTVVESDVTESRIRYLIKGPGGIVTQMDMNVAWQDVGDGQRRVTLRVSDFLTDQLSYFFIPIGPKSVTAMGSLKRFASRLREELS